MVRTKFGFNMHTLMAYIVRIYDLNIHPMSSCAIQKAQVNLKMDLCTLRLLNVHVHLCIYGSQHD